MNNFKKGLLVLPLAMLLFGCTRISSKTTKENTTEKTTTKKSTTEDKPPVVEFDYKITYDLDGGTNNPNNPVGFNDGDVVNLLDATKLGYDFSGWYTNSSFSGQPVSKITIATDYDLYAKFDLHNYVITYNNVDGLNNPNPEFYTINDSTINLVDVEKDGSVFEGWFTTSSFDSNSKIETINTSTLTDYTLYAKFRGTKTNPIVNVTGKDLTYNTLEQELLNASVEGGTIYYSLDNENYTEEMPKGLNAGSYVIYYKVIGDENHSDLLDQSITVSIKKATINMDGVVFNGDEFTYDGNSKSIYVDESTLPIEITGVNYTNNGKINADTYTVTASFVYDIDNYNTVANKTATLKINKATASFSTPTAIMGLAYNGNLQTLINAGSVDGGYIEYKYGSQEWSTSLSKATYPGTYEIDYRFVLSDNYNPIDNGMVSVTVDKGTIDMSGISFANAEVTYDGNEHSLTITGTLHDDVEVSYEGTGTNVGPYDITAKFTVDTDLYYAIDNKTAVLTIKPAKMTNVIVTGYIAMVDDETHNIVANKTATTVDGSEVTWLFSKDGEIWESEIMVENPSDSGTYRFKAMAANHEDYVGSFEVAIIEDKIIATIEITNLTALNKTYDKKAIDNPDITTNSNGTVSISYSTDGVNFTSEKPINSGHYTIKVETAETNQYAKGSLQATFDISKAKYDMKDVNFDGDEVTYDGETHSLAISGTLPEGVTVSYENNDKVTVGSYTVIAKFSGDTTNYELIDNKTATLKINKRTPTTLGITVNYDEGIGSFFSTSKTVSSITFNGTYDVEGTISYNDSRESLEIGTYSYSYIFVPVDETNYESVTGTVEIITKATVKYYNGDTLINTLYVAKNGTATNLSLPTKSGYTSNGWTLLGSSSLFDFTTLITDNLNLYAKYTLDTYTITYNLAGGELVNPISSYTVNTETFTLPTPTFEDYIFNGWTGEGITTPTLTVQITKGSTGNKVYTAVWTELSDVAYFLNNTTKRFKTIEKALAAATSGDIVCVIPPEGNNYHSVNNNVDSTEKVTYYINANCEIKAGVTLVLPTDLAHISSVTSSSTLTTYINSMAKDDANRPNGELSTYGSFARSNEAKYLRVTVEIAQGVTLTNNGTLVVSGYLSGGVSSGGVFGQTSHSYSQIVLNSNAKIIQNNANAKTYCFGYITEKVKNNSSQVEYAKGTLYIPFIVDDYRGFSYSWAMTDGAIDNYGCSAFNQFEFRNIDSFVKFDYNSNIIGIINTYVKYDSSLISVNENFYNELNILGNTSSYVFQLTNSTYSSLTYKYDKASQVADINIYGGMTMNNLSLTLSKSIVTVNLSTTNGYFPVSWRQNVKLLKANGQTSAIYNTSKQSIKLLPGANLEIGDGCALTAKKMLVYTAFGDGSSFNGASSACGHTQTYPLKPGAILQINDGATASFTAIAGNVYYDNANVTYSNNANTILAYEPWSIGSSGSTTPAWTIKDYLEIRESLQKTPISYRTTKQKLYCGINTYKNYDSYIPSYKVTISGTDYEINQYQKTLFLDSISTYSITLVSNIYKCFYGNKTYYQKDSIATYSSNAPYFIAINSNVSISSNKSGINEFNVQSITVNCTTPKIDGNYPLYPGTVVNLEAVIVDAAKAYNKSVTWTSSNTSIATVDSDGKVTGVALGSVTITATCDGKSGTIVLNVIEEQQIDAIQEIYITDNNGGDSRVIKGTNDDGDPGKDYNGGNYSNGTNVTLSLNIVPNTAPYASITWTFKASVTGRQYINDKSVQIETIENVTSVVVHIVSGSGASDDTCTMNCKVIDLKGNEYEATFVMSHKADTTICFTEDTLITLADGSQKMAKDLLKTDLVMTFNHELGIYEATQIAGIYNHGYDTHTVMNLEFTNGYTQRFLYEHGLFDLTLNKYVKITLFNYNDYIGHKFAIYDNSDTNYSSHYVVLENVYLTTEYVGSYNITTVKNINAIINGMLSIETATKGIYNYFEYGDNLKYDEEKMQQDIETYGLASYEEWAEYAPYELFEAFNGKYLNVMIGKGLATKEYFISHIIWTLQLIASGELS